MSDPDLTRRLESQALAIELLIEALDVQTRDRLEARLAPIRRRLEAERPRGAERWTDNDWAEVDGAVEILTGGLEGVHLPE